MHSDTGSTPRLTVFLTTEQKMHESLSKPYLFDGVNELLRRVSGFFDGGSFWEVEAGFFYSSVIFVAPVVIPSITCLLL